jgi:hypothetical protein
VVEELGGSRGHERSGGGGGSSSGGALELAFANLSALHDYVQTMLPAGTVAVHDVAIVQTLAAEFATHLPGGGGAEAAAAAAAASAAAAAAAAPKLKEESPELVAGGALAPDAAADLRDEIPIAELVPAVLSKTAAAAKRKGSK